MPRWLRYLLFFALGIGLGAIYLWSRSSGQGSLESGSDWAAEEVDPQPTPTPTPKPVQILFGGDVMLDRNIRLAAERQSLEAQPEASSTADLEKVDYSFVFDPELHQLLAAQDLVMINLEGTITDNQSISVNTVPGSTNNFFFTFDPVIVETLQANNMWLVNLGNNHILDFSLEGLQATDEYLQAAGIEWFGWVGPDDQYADWNRTGTIWGKDGFKLGLVNYNQFGSQLLENVIEEIELLRDQVDWLVVHPHWGIEYETEANAVIQDQAHQFIDAGADAVIGAHPHVIQQVEEYQGKQIYYSLGNFVFDQYFQPEVKRGLLVQLEFDLSELEVESELGKELAETEGRRLQPVYSEYEVEMLESGVTRLVSSSSTSSNTSPTASPAASLITSPSISPSAQPAD